MIARLSGELILKSPPYLLIEVGGLTYELQAPMSTFYKLPEVGTPVVVLTYLIVREDAHTLYAFYQRVRQSPIQRITQGTRCRC